MDLLGAEGELTVVAESILVAKIEDPEVADKVIHKPKLGSLVGP